MTAPHRCDVLILTAVEEEFDALRELLEQVALDVTPGEDSRRFPLLHARLEDEQGRAFEVVAARPHTLGATAASNIATRLIQEFHPYCLAMCGYCAGKPQGVSLGDVIVAERVFPFDQGKHEAMYGPGRALLREHHRQSTTSFNLDPRWKIRAEEFRKRWAFRREERPVSLLAQEYGFLRDLFEHHQDQGRPHPLERADRRERYPRWSEVLESLTRKEWLRRSPEAREPKDLYVLTPEGRAVALREQYEYPEGRVEKPMAVHVAPMAAVPRVEVDELIWERIPDVEKDTLGLEMEGSAIGLVSEVEEVARYILVKGVQDFAAPGKDRAFRRFASLASADFLLSFLRHILPERQGAEGSPTGSRREGLDEPARHFIREYRTRLQSRFGRWDLAGIGAMLSGEAGSTTASFDSMYLPLRLGVGFDPEMHQAGEVLALDALLARRSPLAICGPAGSGKTTWMRWTFRQLTRHEGALPFMVELRRLAYLWSTAPTRGADRTLDAYLRDWLAETGVPGGGEALPALLDSGDGPRPVLLVDGWDEVGELGERLREQLMGFLAAHPRVLAVVTSRPFGESRPSRGEGFELRHIQPLSDGEIALLADSFFRQVYGESAEAAAASRERFLKALANSPEATSLARTPLLLTMMLLISRHRPLPDKRHLLYGECLWNLLSGRPSHREQRGALLSPEQWRPEDSEERLRVAAELAFHMQSEGYLECRAQVVRRWEELERFLPAEWGRERRRGFLAWLVESAGVMVDRTDGTLTFAHLSFQEYLAAHHLSTTRQGDEARQALCRERMGEPAWWETLRLWAALVEDRQPGSLEPVLEALLHASAAGYWLAGAILADGPGAGVFAAWVEGLTGRFHAHEQAWAELSARAWAASRQEERRADIVSRWPRLAPRWSWLSVFLAKHWSTLARLDLEPEWRNVFYPLLLREGSKGESVGRGRVLNGAVPIWPGMPLELVLLQLWPSPRVQVGSRLQTLLSLGASREELLAVAPHLLARPAENPELEWHWAQVLSAHLLKELSTPYAFLAWDWARDWARHLVRFWGDTLRHGELSQGLVPHLENEQWQDWTQDWKWSRALDWLCDWGESWVQGWSREWVRHGAQTLAQAWSLPRDVPWLADFVLAELQSSQGRSGTRAVLAYMEGSDDPTLKLLQEACRVSLNPRRSTAGLADTLARWESAHGDPLWSALARHIARMSTPQDLQLLDLLARLPEGQSSPLSWGLRYCVRGDLVLADGSTLTLDALCEELHLPHLPYVEDMPTLGQASSQT